MALKKSADGSFDKRTTEYKEMIAKREKTKKANARKATKSATAKKSSKTSAKKTADGTLDKRTKEGKAVAERMAKARASKNSLLGKIKRALR